MSDSRLCIVESGPAERPDRFRRNAFAGGFAALLVAGFSAFTLPIAVMSRATPQRPSELREVAQLPQAEIEGKRFARDEGNCPTPLYDNSDVLNTDVLGRLGASANGKAFEESQESQIIFDNACRNALFSIPQGIERFDA